MTELLQEIQEADLVIAIRRNGSIKAIKNRTGFAGQPLDMADVLELLLPYQPDVFEHPIQKWIKEARRYLSMKAFW
jgi:hypothetical protein